MTCRMTANRPSSLPSVGARGRRAAPPQRPRFVPVFLSAQVVIIDAAASPGDGDQGDDDPAAAMESLSAVPGPAPNDGLYVFYTSGSTGKPKGVIQEHTALIHRISWLQRHHPLLAGKDAVLHKVRSISHYDV